MTPADMDPANAGQAPGTAPGEELTIPKHRFDEVSAELRRLREENAMKDRLFMQQQEQVNARLRAPEPEVNPEEYGDLQDPRNLAKMARAIAAKEIDKQRAVFEQQIGMLANRTEKAELLAKKGSDKTKYLSEIEKMQQDHWRQTGSYMPAEIALDLLQSREKDERIRQLEARLAGGNPPAGTQGSPTSHSTPAAGSYSAPPASGTRSLPTGGSSAPAAGAPANKAFGELSVEEMEARLEEQFRTGVRL